MSVSTMRLSMKSFLKRVGGRMGKREGAQWLVAENSRPSEGRGDIH